MKTWLRFPRFSGKTFPISSETPPTERSLLLAPVSRFAVWLSPGFVGLAVAFLGQGTAPVCGEPPLDVQTQTRAPLQRNEAMLCWGRDFGEYTQITLIDPQLRRIAVYHVDKGASGVELKSVRNLEQDFRLDAFNAKPPLPKDIRAVLEANVDP